MRKLFRFFGTSADLQLVAESGLFDEEFYRAANPDTDFSKIEPIQHYLEFGGDEGRNPSVKFDTTWYVAEYGQYIDPSLAPIVHYLRHNRFDVVKTRPSGDFQKFESIRRALDAGNTRLFKMIAKMPNLSHRLEPRSPRALPLPSLDLMERVGSPSVEDYLQVGADARDCVCRHTDALTNVSGARVLDFGCGAGRVIRHFADKAESAEFWGCDIDGASIMWCMANLSPPFRFFQLSDAPTLPLESDSFDVIYAIAVFSQLFEHWSSWAMEIRRVLKPGGLCMISYNGVAAYQTIFHSPIETLNDADFLVRSPGAPWNQGGPHTFMSDEWIRRMWGSLFDVEHIDPQGLHEQSVAVLRKPASRK